MLISRQAKKTLETAVNPTVFAVFRRTLLLISEGELVAFVTSDYGLGPFHVVVESLPHFTAGEIVTVRYRIADLHLGPMVLHKFATQKAWDPRILPMKNEKKNLGYQNFELLLAILNPRHGAGFLEKIPHLLDPLFKAFQQNDANQMKSAVKPLAGLGPGLTPSGDDFLSGLIFGLWLQVASGVKSVVTIKQYIEIIVQEVVDRTNSISRAFILAAGRCEFDIRWHSLVHSLVSQSREKITASLLDIENFGSTSGKDMLDGLRWFLQMFIKPQLPC